MYVIIGYDFLGTYYGQVLYTNGLINDRTVERQLFDIGVDK